MALILLVIMMTNFLQYASIKKGLIVPENEAFCGIKIETPNYHEMELATRQHRWKRMRDIQRNLFRAFVAEMQEESKDILRILRLPSMDDIREAELQDIQPEGTQRFRYTLKMHYEIGEVFREWQEELLSEDLVKVALEDATYPHYMLESFSLGLDKTATDILRELPDYIKPEEVESRLIQATLRNEYLRGAILQGGDRIKTEIGIKYMNDVRDALKRMARDGEHPMKVGRYLWRRIMEGRSWYWNRLARSESVLALNAAFNASVRQFKVPYEYWSAAPTACPICSYFHGKHWRVGEGPEPVTSTHPHCLCGKRVKYVIKREVLQDRWDRPSPYSLPYTQREISYLESRDVLRRAA